MFSTRLSPTPEKMPYLLGNIWEISEKLYISYPTKGWKNFPYDSWSSNPLEIFQYLFYLQGYLNFKMFIFFNSVHLFDKKKHFAIFL